MKETRRRRLRKKAASPSLPHYRESADHYIQTHALRSRDRDGRTSCYRSGWVLWHGSDPWQRFLRNSHTSSRADIAC